MAGQGFAQGQPLRIKNSPIKSFSLRISSFAFRPFTLRVYADGVPAPGKPIFPSRQHRGFHPHNAATEFFLVRASPSVQRPPKAYDGVTGIMSIAENNGQGIRAAFVLRNNLYFVKERSLYVTATDGGERASALVG